MAKMPLSSDVKNKNKKKSKKSKRTAPNGASMKHKAPKDNPFETIWSRRKFDIIGKKRKGEECRTGLARSRAIDKRKNTLLKEYERSEKSCTFLDKRIGEENDALGEFDKAILRSQRERQLNLKKSKYNLSDGEEDELDIQGLGSFSGRDDFDDELHLDDDNDIEGFETKNKPAYFRQTNVQELMEGVDERQKSKKEVMGELIAKSKHYKAEKAKDKEENEQLAEQLDKDFATMRQDSSFVGLTRPNKKKHAADEVKGNATPTMPKAISSKQVQSDSYDMLVKEMALEIRARPSNRTKTPEEIAQEERERLEQLEEERQKRMLAADDSTDEDDDSPADVQIGSKEGFKSVSGDDLGDSFSNGEPPKAKRGWIDDIYENNEKDELDDEDSESSEQLQNDEDVVEVECDENSDEDEKNLSLKDWEQSDDENFSNDLEEDEDVNVKDAYEGEDEDRKELKCQKKETDNNLYILKKKTAGKQLSNGEDSLPYLIEAPNDFNELCKLLETKSNADIIEAISRIRKSNAICLTPENRRKIQRFYGALLMYFAVLANKKPLDLGLLNLLVKPLMEMSVEIPFYAAICARYRISHTRKLFVEATKHPGTSGWPSSKTLLLLRLWSMIFPCSDFRHVVMTPALLLMCEYLMRCTILCGRDASIGSFLCGMVLSVVKQSRKFCPEALVFLQTVLVAAVDRQPESCQNWQLHSILQIKASNLLSLKATVDDIAPLDFIKLMEMPEESPFFSSDNFRASVLVSVVETLRGFVNTYEELNSFPEIFTPISTLLLQLAEHKHMPGALQDKLKDVSELIQRTAHKHHMLRKALQMRKQKPVPIRLLNPKFEENYVKGRDYDPDRERAERRKLKKLIKQEASGAVRELRKDNYFLFAAKERNKAIHEEERSEKLRKARAFMQEQENDFKSGKLGKGRKRKA